MCEAQEKNSALHYQTSSVCVCVGYLVYIWTEVGVGAASLAAVSAEGGREGACRILCVSSTELPGGSASLADVQKPPHHRPPAPFTPSFPSWSIFLFCLRALRTQRPFKTATEKTHMELL